MNIFWTNKTTQSALGKFQVCAEGDAEKASLKLMLAIANQEQLMLVVSGVDQTEDGEVTGFTMEFKKPVVPAAAAPAETQIQVEQQSVSTSSAEPIQSTDDVTLQAPDPVQN